MRRITVAAVDYVPDFTGGRPEYTDAEGRAWIRPETLAARFRELCAQTGMTGKALAEYTGVSTVTFCSYRAGKTCCPRAVWKMVEGRKIV